MEWITTIVAGLVLVAITARMSHAVSIPLAIRGSTRSISTYPTGSQAVNQSMGSPSRYRGSCINHAGTMRSEIVDLMSELGAR